MSDEPAEAGAVIRLLVAEDTSILRETLVTLFSLEDGIARTYEWIEEQVRQQMSKGRDAAAGELAVL